jgi:hypothetical protein
MELMNVDSRQSIFFGVHFLLAANWTADGKRALAFQKALMDEGVEFSESAASPKSLTLNRKEGSPLQIKVGSVGPQVSEIRISTPERPSYTSDPFCQEAEAICRAYTATWPSPAFQLLQCDATVRHLYSCGCHAFKYLWENRLGQDENDLRYLGGRPVLGGGLRLVLPRIAQWKDHVEVKIESFLGEAEKLFIETMFVWPEPFVASKADDFKPTWRLQTVDKYSSKEVCDFILKRAEQEDDK